MKSVVAGIGVVAGIADPGGGKGVFCGGGVGVAGITDPGYNIAR